MSAQPIPTVSEAAPLAASIPRAGCTILLEDREIHVPASALTLDGFRAWATSDDFPERVRITFIEQELFIDMSPEELETHSKLKATVGTTICVLNNRRDLGEYYPDGSLVTNPAAKLSTEPDGTFVLWESLESGRVRKVPRKDHKGEYMELAGSPDWVMEIVSRSTIRKDTQRLRAKYHRANVTEYWLINAFEEEMTFQILHHEPTGYVPAPQRGSWQYSRVFGRYFRLERQRGRMGFWKYTLRSKA
jgi:Uma2 family endonuclease